MNYSSSRKVRIYEGRGDLKSFDFFFAPWIVVRAFYFSLFKKVYDTKDDSGVIQERILYTCKRELIKL